jgi:hypothetical protein
VVVTGQLLIGARGDDRGVDVLGAQWRAGARADRRHGGGPKSAVRRRPATWHGGVKVLRELGEEEAGGVAQRGDAVGCDGGVAQRRRGRLGASRRGQVGRISLGHGSRLVRCHWYTSSSTMAWNWHW